MTGDDSRIDAFIRAIEETASSVEDRQHYRAYSHGTLRSTYVHNHGRIVRVRKSNLEISQMAIDLLGEPNGMTSNIAGQDNMYHTWFLDTVKTGLG